MLRRGHREHAVHEASGQTLQRPRALHRSQGARRGDIEAQLDPRIGGVDRLPAGTRRVAEPPAQLALRDDDRAADAKGAGHAGSMAPASPGSASLNIIIG